MSKYLTIKEAQQQLPDQLREGIRQAEAGETMSLEELKAKLEF